MFQNQEDLWPPWSNQLVPNSFINSQDVQGWLCGKELIWNWNTQDRQVDNELFECFWSASVIFSQYKIAFLQFPAALILYGASFFLIALITDMHSLSELIRCLSLIIWM